MTNPACPPPSPSLAPPLCCSDLACRADRGGPEGDAGGGHAVCGCQRQPGGGLRPAPRLPRLLPVRAVRAARVAPPSGSGCQLGGRCRVVVMATREAVRRRRSSGRLPPPPAGTPRGAAATARVPCPMHLHPSTSPSHACTLGLSSGCRMENMVVVGSSGQGDQVSSFSNRGRWAHPASRGS